MHISFKQNKKASEEELLQHYLDSGDLDILGELYNRYIHLVYGVCLKYFENRELSKDAVSQIFEILITEIPKYEINNFRSWLYVVTKNHCLMEIRRNRATKRREEKYSAENFMDSTDLFHPIDEAPNSQLEEQLKHCIEKLKQEQQQCVCLFYYDNKCYNEIAEQLNIDQKKVKSFIQNGKRNLKICIEQQMKKANV